MDVDKQRVLVLIDAENVSSDYAGAVFRAVDGLGITIARQAFGDFASGRCSGWIETALRYAVDFVQVGGPAVGKNATDIRLTIEAIDRLRCDQVDIFCLVSCDGDFTPLALYLRAAGKIVVGMGGAPVSKNFVKSCTSFEILQKNLADEAISMGSTACLSADQPSKAQGIIDCVTAAVNHLRADKDQWIPLSVLGQALRVIDPNFKSRLRGSGTLANVLSKETKIEVKKSPIVSVRFKSGLFPSPAPIMERLAMADETKGSISVFDRAKGIPNGFIPLGTQDNVA